MNKAFVRDPEPRDPSCPEPRGCDALGVPVGAATIEAQLSIDDRASLGSQAYYCPNPRCVVGYFDALGATVPLARVARPAYPKPRTAPLCNCLGVSAESIVEDARRGDRDRIRQVVAASRDAASRCASTMPSGCSCATEARRLFMEHFRPGAEPGSGPLDARR